jgi:hypothetical protein
MSNNQPPQQPPNEDELSKIDALIAQHSDVFEGTQLRYSKAVRYGEDKKNAQGASVPHGGYRCHKCGEAGHFIQDCPLNTEEGRAGKVRQARGIPKTFLESISEAEASKVGTGAFVSSEGDLVIMKQATKEERLRLVGPSVDVELQRTFGACWSEIKECMLCYLCGESPKNPVVTSCCGELFCRQCILGHLDRRLMECPNCEQKSLVPTDLIADESVPVLTGSQLATNRPASTTSHKTAGRRPTALKAGPQPPHTKLDIDLELDILGTGVAVHGTEIPQIHRSRNPNTILVPGGNRNPFFDSNGPLLTEAEFDLWQTRYKKAIA